MKKILIAIVLLMLIFWTPQTPQTHVCNDRDTVKVFMNISNLFYVVVPALHKGNGFGRNIPDLTKVDTTFFIKYPNTGAYRPIARDSLRLKLNKLVL